MRGLFEGWHIVVLAVVILLLFGWKKMPDMARSFGRSARILKSEMDGMKDDSKSEAAGQTVKGQPAQPAPTAAAPTAAAPPAQSMAPTDATPVSEPPANPVAPSDPVNQHPSV